MHGHIPSSEDKSTQAQDLTCRHILDDSQESFSISYPESHTSPLVFASPHSGRCYPRAFFSACIATPLDLRRVEDAYVDVLFDDIPAIGAPLLRALVGRACLDLNRASNELDAHLIDPPMKSPRPNRTPRVQAGLGCIPRIAFSGKTIYGRKLTPDEVKKRIRTIYLPYHKALDALIDTTRKHFGVSFLIDCHSMPSQSEIGGNFPDIVLGDRFGGSCSAELTQKVEDAFTSHGYSVARNRPYAGGFITQSQGRPEKQRHALQIEINRKLYLDEQNVLLSENAKNLKSDINSIFKELNIWAKQIAPKTPKNIPIPQSQ
ncbi:N-formylglutamate amidohydrolase [Hirschia baltica]|uniref:N-formylglutamate amidohydrolase n=1 Tax=Hirschia baltica (strain ATCC 49814 / DSM 5838 / IFAM 1418) TaxID=582402 RepID=C6XRP5_HIRBI|nr:N-formylglutamate amidohydrolase [Hirschia baltica]ACT60655.1 N-formylglutamate amidohydrolase [Hirschia baltica ATCC 49814]